MFDINCRRCPRLSEFLDQVAEQHPDYYCQPVDAFGVAQPKLLLVGLAPGMHGANASGRPFTGDHSGVLLFQTLYDFGFANRAISSSADDGLKLKQCKITNAVKCLPPQNKPTSAEIIECNHYLHQELCALKKGSIVVALGLLAHQAILRALSLKPKDYKFAHGAEFTLPNDLTIIDSYHCSRYNTQTRRLTDEMFRLVFARARQLIDATQDYQS